MRKRAFIRGFEFLIVLVLCCFPLWYNMDVLPINQWDEARNAVNTVEMIQNQNFLVRTYEGVPETWEPKPPLLIWLQVASAKVFGLNELAIRFPVMVATLLTVLMLILYFYKYFNNRYTGYLAALVLVTSQGYIDRHLARTGDHDALLILFVTGIVLFFYRYLITDKPRPHMMMGIALLFILGVYTKSIAAFFAFPGLFISLFVFRSWKKLFSDKWFYIALACFIISTGAYYVIRENIQPGYLNAVWQWELFPRYANTENRFDSGTFWYYAINFYQSRFTWWIGFLAVAVIALPFMLRNDKRKFFFYTLINTVSLFLILSAGSKNLWYDGPLYPLFAIIISLFLNQIIQIILKDHFPRKLNYRIGRIIFVIVFIIMVFYFPYQSIIRKISRVHINSWDRETYSLSYLLRDRQTMESLPDPLRIVYEGYHAHLLFYVEAENLRQNRERFFLGNFTSVEQGDTIMISQQMMMDSIKMHFGYQILLDRDPVKVVKILPHFVP